MADPNKNGGVCAVIVTYNPDPACLKFVLNALVSQVSAIVVVDNGSKADIRALVKTGSTHVCLLGENLGVAAGFNRGVEWARDNGCQRVLLLDQDSVAAPDMVALLDRALDELLTKGEQVAAVGPRTCDPVTGHSTGFARFGWFRFYLTGRNGGTSIERVSFLISSGSMIPIATLQEVRLMDEGLFIDLVDTEWFLRAAALGYAAFGVCNAVLHHSLGDRSIKVPTKGGFIPAHSPLRHYYFFRNSMLLNRRREIPLHWKYNNGVQLVMTLVFFSLFAAPRMEHLRMMLRGLRDGMRGRKGRAE